MHVSMNNLKTRELLALPEFDWWYNALQLGDVKTITDTLSKSSAKERDKLLNGKSVNTKPETCGIRVRKEPKEQDLFEVTAPLSLALTSHFTTNQTRTSTY